MNFGGISEEEFSTFEAARVLVWPISYEGTVSYGGGTGEGAMAIIDASRNMELYDEETDAEVYKLGIHTVDLTEPTEPPEAMMKRLLGRARELVQTGKFVCMIGGEHSVSGPVIEAHAERYENLSVLQIDAHADLRDSYDGTKHSHASIMARVVKDLRIPAVQVGIRSISAEEARALDRLPTRIFWAKDIVGRTDWWDEAVDGLTENVYLTIDIDGLDPSLVAQTGTPEPGGLEPDWLFALIARLGKDIGLVAADCVEVAPPLGPTSEATDATTRLAARYVRACLELV